MESEGNHKHSDNQITMRAKVGGIERIKVMYFMLWSKIYLYKQPLRVGYK